MKDLELLKKLTSADGIGSREDEVRNIMKDEFLKYVSRDNIEYDGLGSIVAKKVGLENGPKIMLAAHMDEVGMIVSKITPEGFIKFQTVGDWWSQVMLAQKVTITTRTGKKYRGVLGSIPPHILTANDLKNPVKIEDTYIDLGVSSQKEVEDLGINIGDMITPYLEFEVMNNEDYLLAKAWDNRIGCAMAIKVLEELNNVEHPNIIYSVGTVQEEIGYRGAKTAANLVEPDIAIALDVSIAKDVPGADRATKLGDGPGLLIYDSQLVGHVGLRNKIIEIAEELNIPYQFDYLKTSGTDSGKMHTVHAGCPAISFCIETRYIHSHTSIISKKDYENGVKLIVELIKRLDRKTVDQITYDE